MISMLLSFLVGPLILISIGFALGYYYFGHKEKVNKAIKKQAKEYAEQTLDKLDSSPSSSTSVPNPI